MRAARAESVLLAELTVREMQVRARVARGLTNGRIAVGLCMADLAGRRSAAFGQAGQLVVLSVPFGQLAEVVSGALLAGALDSGPPSSQGRTTQALVDV